MTDPTEKLIEEAAKGLTKAVSALLGEAASELAATFAESVAVFRIKNLSNAHAKVQLHLRKVGANASDLKPIATGASLRILESLSLEEDENLQDLWAKLIATQRTSERPTIDNALIEIVKQLTPIDARVLSIYFDAETTPDDKSESIVLAIRDLMKSEEHALATSAQNLMRLRLMGPYIKGLAGEGARRYRIDSRQLRSGRDVTWDGLDEDMGAVFDGVKLAIGFNETPLFTPTEIGFRLKYSLTALGNSLRIASTPERPK